MALSSKLRFGEHLAPVATDLIAMLDRDDRGTVIANGPTNDGNGPLDYLGTFNISGGFLVAVGSSGMAQVPSATQGAVSGLNGQRPAPLFSSDLNQHRVRARALAG